MKNAVKGFRFYSKHLNAKIIFFPPERKDILSEADFPIEARWLQLVENYENAVVPYQMINDENTIAVLNEEAKSQVAKWDDQPMPDEEELESMLNILALHSQVGAWVAESPSGDGAHLFDIDSL